MLVISNSCSAHFLEKESIAVALPYTFRSNHTFPGLVVCAHSGIEVPEEDVCLSAVLQKLQNPDHHRTCL